MRKTLDVWPPLPISIEAKPYENWDMDDIILALEHSDRIFLLELLPISSSELEKVLAAMQQPFPALTRLHLRSVTESAPVDPDSFLGGFAPRLQVLFLEGIPFLGLPKLLLSATHLVYLNLSDIPHSGYISPEAIVAGLSALTSLESFRIEFESPQSCPDQKNRRPLLQTRTLLPALVRMAFQGVGEYLEELVARIDSPLLHQLDMVFYHQLTFDTPQLAQFIGLTPNFKAPDEARVVFSISDVLVMVPMLIVGTLRLVIPCEQLDSQLSPLAQICSSTFPQAFIPSVERLYLIGDGYCGWPNHIEYSQWVELLHPYTAVKDLYMSCDITPNIAPVLQELVGESVTEVLPALKNIFLGESLPSGSVQEAIKQFVVARRLVGHPITVSIWEREEDDSDEC